MLILSTYLLCEKKKPLNQSVKISFYGYLNYMYKYVVQIMLNARERNDVNNAASSREKQMIASIQTEKAKFSKVWESGTSMQSSPTVCQPVHNTEKWAMKQ